MITAIIQARMGSTRLPQKIIRDLAGEPMLARVVNRVKQSKLIDKVIVATTREVLDDFTAQLCDKYNWDFYRGSANDVLDRYLRTARAFKADVIVRITADCPLIDPGVIDEVVNKFLSCNPKVDYASNVQIRTYPRGLDVEVFTFEALEKAWTEDTNPATREHVTPYIWQHPDKFNILSVCDATDHSFMRWCVDTREDLMFAQRIYDTLLNDTFGYKDVLHLLEIYPEWQSINREVKQKLVPVGEV